MFRSNRKALRASARRLNRHKKDCQQSRHTERRALFFESLEERSLLATFAVTTTGDKPDADLNDAVCADSDGACSLKAAIENTNQSAGADTINFNLTGSGPFLINADQLTITDSVIIDGTTQPGYVGQPVIEVKLDVGSHLFAIEANDSTIRGLSITGAAESGLLISGDGNLVEDNFIGVKTNGLTPEPNLTGVFVSGSSNTIRSNVISGNSGHGISISGAAATNNLVQGNSIGTNVAESLAVANGKSGISIDNSASNTIGGLATQLGQAPGNVISGNSEHGIQISGELAKDNKVLGNIIGEDRTGSNAVSNMLSGILIENAADNIIGGAQTRAANVIGGNIKAGVHLLGSAASGNEIMGNFIGVGAANRPIGNEQGVLIENADNNFVGGSTTGEGNQIRANRSFGVEIRNGSGNSLLRNLIGGDAANAALANGDHGVQIQGSDNNVGDFIDGGAIGNAIQFNQGSGVVVIGSIGTDSLGNQIVFNSIQGNGLLGIDLNADGPTANDPLDADAGQNGQQNFPVLTQIESSPSGVLVTGELNSEPLKEYFIDFYRNTNLDIDGIAEGEIFLGRIGPLASDIDGKLILNVNLGTGIPQGSIVVAMATDAATKNSSEFSFPAVVAALLDFGDAPDDLFLDSKYPTLLENNGARHVITPGFHLGSGNDDELNGQPNSGATGDDISNEDDENGVRFETLLVQGGSTDLTVNASAAGKLDAWIDFNADGDWDDENEQIFTSIDLTAGDNMLSINVPSEAMEGNTFARFRFSSAGGLSPSGLALNGEVEDYKVQLFAPAQWRNDNDLFDVNDDGVVAPLDALLVINWLNKNGSQSLPHPSAVELPPFLDVSGDNQIAPLDALLVINFLNKSAPTTFASADLDGEGEGASIEIEALFKAEVEFALSLNKQSGNIPYSSGLSRLTTREESGTTTSKPELLGVFYPQYFFEQEHIMDPILSDLAERVSQDWEYKTEDELASEEVLFLTYPLSKE